MTHRFVRTIFCLALLAGSISLLNAQSSTTGQISGVVTDPTGAVVPSAKLTLTSESGLRREVSSGEDGSYLFSLVPPGVYRIEAAAQGFKTVAVDQVTVRITEVSHLDIALQVSSVPGEIVNVTGEPPLVQTATPATGRVVDTRSVSELPLATRNFTQILGLSTGAATYLPDNTAVGRNSQNISVNGARVTNNNFQINGVDANSMGTNSAPSLSIPAPETIQEFKVQTSLYDASFGRSAGGNIQAVTKSGTNDLHGSVYEYFRNDKLNANNTFLKAAGVARPALKRNVFGGTLGGPIRKDKLFFFGSYQGTRERNGASIINSLSSNVLIAPGLTDDRSEATLLRTFKPVQANGQAAASINATTLALLNAKLPGGQYVIPTPQTASGRYSGSTPSIYREDQFNANADYRIGDRNSLAFKLFFMNAPQTLTLPSFLGGGPNVPGWGNDQKNNGRILALTDTHVFGPNVVNEFRAGYNFLRVDAFPQEPVRDDQIGIKRANAATFPGLGQIAVAQAAGGFIIGTSATIDVRAVSPSTTFADVVSIVRGKHTIRAGGEFRYNENNYVLNFFTRGTLSFLSFNDFLLGNTFVSVFGSGIGNRSLRAHDYNLFTQDDWKISRKLTLNLGLRYELDMPPFDTRGRIATFDPGLYKPRPLQAGGVPLGPPAGGFVQAGNVIDQYASSDMLKVDKRVVKSIDPNNFAPRFGFAYSPLASDQMVVRGGYGIYYARTSFQYITLNVIAPPTYVFGVNVGRPISDPYFAAPPQSAFPTLIPGVNLSGTLFDRDIRTPYLQQFNLGLQYQLSGSLLLEAGWVGTHGLNLFRQVGINQARLASAQNPITNDVTGAVITTNTAANAVLRAPYSGVSQNGFFQNQSTAQSVYHSLQTSLTKRFSHGVQFLASYTWAKSIDNASGQGGGAGVGGVVNPGAVGESSGILGDQLNNRANRGVSDFDRTHRFVLSGLWSLPSPSRAKLLLGDWQVGGIVTAMSGLPIDIVDTGSASLFGLSGGSAPLARASWASGATRDTAMSNVPAGYYFNPAAFVRPVIAAGQPIPSTGGKFIADGAGTDFGNIGRNMLRGPNQSNVDFSVFKRFPVGEKKHLEFRAEFFNLFNRVNLANPISDLNSVPGSGGVINAAGQITNAGSFGRIISATNNPRLAQLALRFIF